MIEQSQSSQTHFASTPQEAWKLRLVNVASKLLDSGISSQDHVLIHTTVCTRQQSLQMIDAAQWNDEHC